MPTMRAIVITRPGGPEVLELRDVPRPTPGASEVLVRVRATALNRADLLQRQGRYPAPPGTPSDIPGLEFAGEVAEVGERASMWRAGDRVFGVTGGGAYAEYLVADERTLARVPDTLDLVDAGAVPEAFITAHDAMVTQAAIRPGETVMVHAVGSGVGLTAVQLARAFGATPFGTARTADKIDRARALGLEDGIVVRDDLDPIVAAAERWTSGHGIDVTLELVGGDYATIDVKIAARFGRIVLIGTVAGGSATIPLGVVMGKRLTIRGTVLRARSLDEKAAATAAFALDVVPLLAAGTVRPIIDRVFPLAQATDAHRLLESNSTFGKIVLTVE